MALQFDSERPIVKSVPLGDVAGKTRHMAGDFLHPEENRLAEAGMAYLRRLLPRASFWAQKRTPRSVSRRSQNLN